MKDESTSRIITNDKAVDKSKIGYVRVSTAEQNEARQLESFRDLELYKVFVEKKSAKDTNRPMLQTMLDYVRDGDILYITDFSRISRSVKDLLELVEYLQDKHVRLISQKENLDTNSATGKLMLTLIAAINEFERTNLLERQREGIAIAKREGKYKGRKTVTVPGFENHYRRYMRHDISKAALAKELKISRPTLDKLIERCKIAEVVKMECRLKK